MASKSSSSLSVQGARAWGAVAALLALVLLAQEGPLLHWLRLQVFDSYARALPRERVSAPAVVVAVDERSLAEFGQWPWPRTRLAAIIARIAEAGPAAIGLDIYMPEPDRLSPRRISEQAAALDPELARRLGKLPDNDELLAATIEQHPVVLGFGTTLWEGEVRDSRALPSVPMLLRGSQKGTSRLMQFQQRDIVRSVPVIEAAARGHGLLSAPLDGGLVHQVPLLARVDEVLLPTFAVELLRVAAGVPALEATFAPQGLTGLRVGDLDLPAERDGKLWLRYGAYDASRYISASDVLAGRVDPRRFERHVVLVAVTGLGLLDQLGTPINARVPGIEIHTQLIENLFEQSWLRRPSWAHALEIALLGCATLLVLLALPAVSPRAGFTIVAALGLAFVVLGLGAYVLGLLIDVATPAAGTAIVSAVVLGAVLTEAQRHRLELAGQLQNEREAAARMAGELDAARRVQTGMLPDPATVLAGEPRLAIEAWLQPAREVGGDLYDFFALDERRWCVLIGDVSGKGLPAAMFMALVKAQCQACLMRHPDRLDRAMAAAEQAIDRHNPEAMFVTLLVLVVDLQTGGVEYCNAGHEPAWLLREGAAPAVLDGAARPAIGVLDGYAFDTGSRTLKPGDCLFLITDGVTEAMDQDESLYGRGRLGSQLALFKGLGPRQMVDRMRADLEDFAGRAEQHDDLAIIAVRWNGPTTRSGEP